MGHRLITWWNPNNAWHRAAAEAVLKAFGAPWFSQRAEVEGLCGRSEGSCNSPPAGDDTQSIDRVSPRPEMSVYRGCD